MLLLFLGFFISFLSLAIAKCPDGTVASLSNPSNCYLFGNDKTNFLSAEELCIQSGGHLTSIHNAFDGIFISELAASKFPTNDDLWIGASSLMTPGTWAWMDGTPFDFQDWGKGQPSNTAGNNCGSMLISNGFWNSTDCTGIKPFVCLIQGVQPTVPPLPSTTALLSTVPPPHLTTTPRKSKTCDFGWTYYDYTGFCYKVFDNKNWLDAEERCKVDGGHLTSVHSSEENLFLQNFATYPGADVCDYHNQSWIGFYSEDNTAHWKWTDGTLFDYTNWVVSAPWQDNGVNYCGFMDLAPMCGRPGAQMENVDCNEILRKFICKKSTI